MALYVYFWRIENEVRCDNFTMVWISKVAFIHITLFLFESFDAFAEIKAWTSFFFSFDVCVEANMPHCHQSRWLIWMHWLSISSRLNAIFTFGLMCRQERGVHVRKPLNTHQMSQRFGMLFADCASIQIQPQWRFGSVLCRFRCVYVLFVAFASSPSTLIDKSPYTRSFVHTQTYTQSQVYRLNIQISEQL